MAHANFKIVVEGPDGMILKDVGPWDQHPTITNDPEWVVDQIASRLNDRVLLYLDSDGDLSQLVVKDGKFAGFQPWTAES